MIGIVDIQDEHFITDRDNRNQVPVEGVTLDPTWDIDRTGSKGHVTVTAEGNVLEAGMWLSTYRTITPERGSIVRYPRGHWHLFRPGTTYDGGYAMDTAAASQIQLAAGTDIVDDIAGVTLTEPFYTPVGGTVMQDVQVLIKMASAGIMGPNLLVNGSFENNGTGWYGPIFSDGAAGGAAWEPYNALPADGDRSWSPQLNSGLPNQGRVWTSQVVPVPSGATYIYAMGIGRRLIFAHDIYMECYFRDDGESKIGDSVYTNPREMRISQWTRQLTVLPVPVGAVDFVVALHVRMNVDGYGSGSRSDWDDIRVGTCTHMPIPDDRIQLPLSGVMAATRIQTDAGKSTLYEGINADRLGAIGHFALSADMEGNLTTSPMRTLENAIPKYTFGPNDIDLIGEVSIPESTERPLNHWRAVKENFEDATLSMVADSYNNNANDPFSVIQSGQINSAPNIVVQDAVDQAALQAVADQARDSYALTETVRFATMPLADLTVYDVVAIDDPDMPDVNGKWALNSIDAGDDYLVITATRAVSREI